MSKLVKEIRLIYTDATKNNNKWWTGKLFEDGTVITEWARVGKNHQSKTFNNVGESFLLKKKREKEKKGYSELKTVATSGVKEVELNGDLKQVAQEQIKTNSPELNKLIDRLVKYNIHKITSSTQISYNASTGLFSTPLGVVTQDGIDEARELLVKIKQHLNNKDKELINYVNQYLRLIPTDIGMKFSIDKIFPDEKAIVKQNDILDSLESSYASLKSNPTDENTTKEKKKQEQVFATEIHSIDEKELNRIADKFYKGRQRVHVSYNFKIKQAFKVNIQSVKDNFDKRAKEINNVKELWHGTKKSNLLSILKGGLRIAPPSTAYVVGAMFSRGLYFANSPTKSLNYSAGFWQGKRENTCFMFLADVALGNYFVPTGPTSKQPPKGYDSYWAQGRKSGVMNDEFIIQKENQHNLTYLIEFE